MKKLFDPEQLPGDGLLLTCSSHEDRCLAIPGRWQKWRPSRVMLFHYDDENERRERNHAELRRLYNAGAEVVEVVFREGNSVESFRANHGLMRECLEQFHDRPIFFDISVFTKRTLLMILQWLDDYGCWPRLFILYSEPEEYEVTSYIPLSFGVSSIEALPGFSAAPDSSRPLHVVIFLGFEGDRTLATYEILQPKQTTLVAPSPAFRSEWEGKSEQFNRDLISIVGDSAVRKVDPLDPERVYESLMDILGPAGERGEFSRIICPLGSKPQAVGAYLYHRHALDPPALVYTGPLRHNHHYFSRGIHNTWVVMGP